MQPNTSRNAAIFHKCSLTTKYTALLQEMQPHYKKYSLTSSTCYYFKAILTYFIELLLLQGDEQFLKTVQ